jgi:signal transduction histidine kinase
VRITALCVAVAAVAVAVAGVVAVRLVGVTAHDVTRNSLSHQADVIAGQVEEAGVANLLGLRRVAQVLNGQGVSVVQARQGRLIGDDTQAVQAAREAGAASLGPTTSISTSKSVGGHTLLVEGRAVSPRAGFALVQPVTAGSDTRHQLNRYILIALAVGLGVAAIAGLLLARVLSRPLRRTADVARTMSAGRRDLRVAVEGPAEVADVASSVNELAEALERSERRQRDFLLSVSHELRTPLTSAMGFAESIKDGVATGDDAVLAGRTIYEETRRLDHLVSDLLDLARIGADEFRLEVQTTDLVPLVAATAEVWARRCRAAGIAFSLDAMAPGSGAVPATVDAQRLRQVLDGLLDNAVRVTPAGRPVVLSLRPGDAVSGGSGGLGNSAEVTHVGAVLEVRDGGPGFAPDDFAVAFERGVLHSRYSGRRPGGSGIGLALIHGLVTRMGGTVEVGPAPEGGARFVIRLGA